MFISLRKALDRRCISLRKYADLLGISEAVVQDKLEDDKDFTYWEFRRTCDLLLPEYNADFLFAETILENRFAWAAIRQSPYGNGKKGDFLSLLGMLPRNSSIL